MDYRIINIGALSHHELWKEKGPTRASHATCTLVRSENKTILIDPGLPPKLIAQRLQERSGLDVSQITDIFLTNFRPPHRWGLAAFPHANWLLSQMEREFVGHHLIEQYQAEEDPNLKNLLQEDIALLKKCQPAPDRIAPQVDLFPLPGYTPGTCGLLLNQTNLTVLVAGDAVPTIEHLEQGRILRAGYDAEQARESFMEAIEIADVIIPGHDNIIINPTRKRF
jgi:glyoxylase-like metal-dependent hydrolase (beta-lactamase superfamily II)